MKQTFIDKNFRQKALATIEQANTIIAEYQAGGYTLTLRQLYYQFVSRDLIPNTNRSYKNLGQTMNDARLAGLVDWNAIEDRLRNLVAWRHYDSPEDAIRSVRDSYDIDMWANQETRVEVWIEKDALTGVIAGICGQLDIPYFACRGFVSVSEMWRAGRRMRRDGRNTVMIHLGDHDPSGMDMTRDNDDRLRMFANYNGRVEVRRIALNMDQVQQYGPPPNPAKTTDSRAADYIAEYGNDSWELDALEPAVLTQLIQDEVDSIRDMDLWAERVEQLSDDKDVLDRIIAKLEEDGDI